MRMDERGTMMTDRIGIVVYSYWQRWQGTFSSLKSPPFRDALDVLDHVQSLGVGSLQIMVDGWTMEFARDVRKASEGYGITMEGIIEAPRQEGDVARFEREIRTAREAGVGTHRCALGGRRYELFQKAAEYKAFAESAKRSLEFAEPALRRNGVRIGVENHKDFESGELASVLNRMSSEHVGSCIDTGNGLALLEDPMEVVENLAPHAVTVHLKDMALKETSTGFQMSEVPLGTGICDVRGMIDLVRSKRPEVTFHLEMITRDPLEIACLTDAYWGTFSEKAGLDLARTLRLVREKGAAELPKIEGKGIETILDQEEQAVIESLNFATSELGFPTL